MTICIVKFNDGKYAIRKEAKFIWSFYSYLLPNIKEWISGTYVKDDLRFQKAIKINSYEEATNYLNEYMKLFDNNNKLLPFDHGTEVECVDK